jgi:calcineurin-like phosphoesterase family protein
VLGVDTIKQHDEKIYDLWTDTVHKRDLVLVLGDCGYDISRIKDLPGRKKVLLGNHDNFHAKDYLEVFEDIIGPVKYKRFWLSHFPIHADELFGKSVICGHTHSKGINDDRYINMSIEMTGGKPISFQDIKSGKYITWNRVNYPFGVVDNSINLNPNAASTD